MLNKSASKKQIDSDIRELEKTVSAVRLTALLAKGESRQQLQQFAKQLESHLAQIKLKAKIDKKIIKKEIDTALNNLSFKEIETGFSEGKTKLKIRKLIADTKKIVRDSPISLNIGTGESSLKNQLAAYKSHGKSASDRIKGLILGINKIGSAFGVAGLAIDNFQKSLKTIRENNLTLTNIATLSNSSRNEMERLGSSAFDTASKFGLLSSNYLEAVQEFNKHGFYGEAGKSLGELSLKAQAAGRLSSETAKNYLLAANAAYGYQGNAEKLSAVLDGQNAIASKHHTNLETMASATETAGAAAANAGIKINELSALIGIISEGTGENGTSIGTGIQSLLLNLQDISSDKITNTLKKANASMAETANGTEKLRNPINILKDLAETYNALDEKNPLKNEITETVGQDYQTQLATLLKGWKNYENMLKEYSYGIGSSDIGIQNTTDSLNGKLNILQNSWDSLVNSIIHKSSAKGGISFLDGLLDTAEKLIDVFNIIPVALAGVTAVITAKNKDVGITKVYDAKNKKLDIEGNLFGIDFTQIKHYKEASNAIKKWNNKLNGGNTDINDFNLNITKNNTQLREYLKTCSVDAPASPKGYKSYLQAAGEATNSLRLSTILLNSAISFGLGIAIQSVVSLISTMGERTETLRNTAYELGNNFNATSSDIDSYKEKITELQAAIHNSGSSIEDVTNARKELMGIQTELINKYGTETDKINAITDAINGQVSALEKLKNSEWYDTKAEYNVKSSDDHIIDFVTKTIPYVFEKIMLFGDKGKMELPKTNLEDTLDEWENQSYSLKTTGNKKLDKLLSESLSIPVTNGTFELNGSVDSLYEKLNAMKQIVASYNVSPDFEESLASVSNDIRSIYESNVNIRSQSILFDKILSDNPANVYDEAYNNLEILKKQYDKAVLEGNTNEINSTAQSYAKALSDSIQLAMEQGDFDVARYFEDMYPELQRTIGELNFKLDFNENKNGIKEQITDSLKTLKNFSLEDFEHFNANTATDEQISAYSKLNHIATTQYNIPLSHLLEILQKQGLVQNEAHQALTKKFGDDNIKKLTSDELEIAYTIKNINGMSFEELQEKIQDLKNEAENANIISFKEAWDALDNPEDTSFQNLKENLLELAMQGKLTAKTFSETEGADNFLKKIKMSANQAKTSVQNLLTTQQKLSAFSQGIASLTAAFQEYKENKFVSSQTLEAFPDAFKSLNGFNLFSHIAGDPTSGKEKIKNAFNEIIQEYIEDQNTLAGVTEENKNSVISNLKNNGITNAAEIVNDYINSVNTTKELISKAETELYSQSEEQREIDLINFQKALQSKNTTFINACKILGTNNANLMSALGQNYAIDYINWVKLCSKKIDTHNKMVTAMNIATDSPPGLNPSLTFKKETGMTPEEYVKKVKLTSKDKRNPMKSQKVKYYIAAQQIIKNKKTNKEAEEAKEKLNQYKTADIDFDVSPYKPIKLPNATTNPSSGTTSIKESKEVIDWLERRFKRMQDIIDLTAAKLQNLFSIKGKNTNLEKQIKQTTKLIRQYSYAINKYKAKAASASKGLSKDIKSKVTSGEVTKKSYSKLIKTYGQEKADKIQNYINWYDKWQEAMQSKEAQKANKRELKKQTNQIYIDQADSKLSMLDAKTEIARDKKGGKSADIVNDLLQEKVKWTKQYYNYQIKNAKLEKDSAKAAELRAQKEKALLDIKIERHQNRADSAEAKYNLYQQYEANAVDAKTKNKYEADSLNCLKKQYEHLIEIAKLEGNTTEEKRLQAEEQAKIAESYKTMYDNIQTEYDNKTGINDAKIATVQAQIATLEAAGKNAAKEMYADMMESSSDTMEKLLKKRAELEKAGKHFEYESQEWYGLQNDLLSIDQQMESCTQQTMEWQKAINALDLRKYSIIADQIASANSQIDFLSDMLSHKKLTSKDAGGLTAEGLTSISLWFDKMENNKKTIENAQNAMAEYQKQIAAGTTGDDFQTQNQKMQEWLQTIREATLADEELKESIVGLVEEAFNVQLDALNELIEKRKKALQTEKDLYDYQRKIASQTKSIANIQKQIAALTGDNSEEARAKLQKLKVNLEEAQQDLKDTEYDKWISDQEDLLDSLTEDMENFFESALQNTDSLIEGVVKAIDENGYIIADTLEKTGYGNANSFHTKDNGDGTYTSTYTDYNGKQYQITTDAYGNNLSQAETPSRPELTIESVKDSLDRSERSPHYIDKPPLLTENINGHTPDRTNASKIEKDTDPSSAYLKPIKLQIEGSLNKCKSLKNQSTAFINKYTFGEYGNELNQYLAEKYGKVYTSWADIKELANILGIKVSGKKPTSKEAKKIRDALKNAGFANGGIASVLNEAAIQNGDDGIATLQRGEGILTSEQTKQFHKFLEITPAANHIMKNTTKLAQTPDITNSFTNSQNVNVGGISIHLDGSGIVDERSFVDTFKRSTMIQSAIDESVAKGMTKTYSNTLGRF